MYLCKVSLQEDSSWNKVWQTLALCPWERLTWFFLPVLGFLRTLSCLTHTSRNHQEILDTYMHISINRWCKPRYLVSQLWQRSMLGWYTWSVKLVVRYMIEVWILFPNTRVSKWIRVFFFNRLNCYRVYLRTIIFLRAGGVFLKLLSTSVQFIAVAGTC